ncbi:MAG: hypothetical protein AAGU27_24215 [Dehalobacterium sp.]
MKRAIYVFLGIFILVSAIFSGCAPTRKPLQNQAKYAAPTQSAKLPPPTPRAPKELKERLAHDRIFMQSAFQVVA